MAPTGVAQINVRLPRALKESGDAGLEALGLSPSDAVRSLWTHLSKRGAELAEVEAFLSDKPEEAPMRRFDESPLAQGWVVVDTGVKTLGLTLEPMPADIASEPDNELIALAQEARVLERGAM